MSQVTTKQLRDELCHELRHGGYVRCTGYLRGPGKLACVLGVAVDVYMRHYGDLQIKFDPDDSAFSFDGDSACLPDRVRKAFGFISDLGFFNDPVTGDLNNLSAMSDAGVSFAVIADLIESNPPGLFIDSPPQDDEPADDPAEVGGAYSPSQDDRGDYAATMERPDRFEQT